MKMDNIQLSATKLFWPLQLIACCEQNQFATKTAAWISDAGYCSKDVPRLWYDTSWFDHRTPNLQQEILPMIQIQLNNKNGPIK